MTISQPQPNRILKQAIAGLLISSVFGGVFAAGAGKSVAAPASATSEPGASRELILAQEAAVVERGSTGELVSELQRRLGELGYYDGPVSGFFGELTEAAVIRFQQDQGLASDGIVGASTADALRDSGSTTDGLLQRDAQGPQVTELQERLTTLGFYDGPVTGFFGALTEAAVIRFQSDRGLTADGIVGATTEAALGESSQSSVPEDSQERATDPTDGLLERSEVGEAVTELQRRLTALGFYDGPIDGSYGPRTETAVSQFQAENNLAADGVAGPNTIAAIDRATDTPAAPAADRTPAAPAATPAAQRVTAPSAPRSSGQIQPASPIVPTQTAIVLPVRVELSPEDIRAIQARLQDRGFYDGPVDGVLNDATRQAIARAQQAYEVSPGDLVFSE
ncbi:MAG: peptidoglycan-binding protein [Elainellaceae cyanobacterium]